MKEWGRGKGEKIILKIQYISYVFLVISYANEIFNEN